MNIANRIKERRKILGMTQQALAEAVGVTQNAIHKLEDGTTQKPRNILEIAKILKCQPSWLLFGRDDPDNHKNDNVENSNNSFGYYPLISWEQASDWMGEVDKARSLKTKFYNSPITCSYHTFLLKVKGFSMEPIFRDGDLIFVDPNAKWHHGSFVVAKNTETKEVTFKQLVIEDNQKFLKATNPNWPMQVIPLGEKYTIIGTVIFAGMIF